MLIVSGLVDVLLCWFFLLRVVMCILSWFCWWVLILMSLMRLSGIFSLMLILMCFWLVFLGGEKFIVMGLVFVVLLKSSLVLMICVDLVFCEGLKKVCWFWMWFL